MPCMVQLISFNSGEFCHELVVDEFVGPVPVVMVKYNWMTEVHSVREKSRYRKDVSDLVSYVITNTAAK